MRHRVPIKPGCFETGQIANTPGETGETKTNNVNDVCQLVLEIWISVHIPVIPACQRDSLVQCYSAICKPQQSTTDPRQDMTRP